MNCQIHRDYNSSEVVRVTTPEGSDSALYNEALKLTNDSEKALNIWSTAYSNTYINTYGKWSKEPSLSNVMEFLNLDSTDSKLSVSEVADVVNSSITVGMQPSDLYSTMRSAFFNADGEFSINKDKLVKAGIYTMEEIQNLLNYPSIRQKVRETIAKIRNSFNEEEPTTETDILHTPLSVQTNEINAVGKYKVIPHEEVESYILNNINKIEDIQNLENESIRDAILDTPEAYSYVEELLKTHAAVPVFNIKHGVALPVDNNDMVPTLLQTTTVNEDKLDFTKAIDDLRVIDSDSWYSNMDIVTPILRSAEREAANVGIDIIGLSNAAVTKSKEEVIGLLDLIDDFNISTENLSTKEDDVIDLVSAINDFFERPTDEKKRIIGIPYGKDASKIIATEGDVSEVDIFNQLGAVKIGDNLYERVGKQGYPEAAERLYNYLVTGNTSVAQEFGGVENLLKDKDQAMRTISNYLSQNPFGVLSNDVDTVKSITALRLIHGNYKEEVDTEDLSTRSVSINKNKDYLTSDFISDFYREMLDEKLKDSDLWNNALKYFNISDRGIDHNIPASILDSARLLLQSKPVLYDNLVDYSNLSKNPSMSVFREAPIEYAFDTIENRRDYIVNNPESLRKFIGEFDRVSDTSVITNGNKGEFIKLNDGIYELTSSNAGVSVYSRIYGVTNPDYYVFNESAPEVDDIDMESFMDSSDAPHLKESFSRDRAQKVVEGLSC